MGAARGIAGSRRPELEGVFLCCGQDEVEFFCRMNAEGTELDVWAVAGVDEDELMRSPNGFVYVSRPVLPSELNRVPTPEPEPVEVNEDSLAYRSTLEITFDDGGTP